MTLCIHHPCQHQNPDTAKVCQACGKPLWIHNQFHPLAQIGTGGFGRTFKAIDEGKPSRPYCVIKQLFFQNADLKRDSIQMFEQEAVQLEKLGNHSQIPTLIWNGNEGGDYYIVQEYIDGDNLAKELADSGPFNEEKIWQVLEELLPLLQHLHEVKVIHRDIKPANIIRRRFDRRLVLVDFGAVKVATHTALIKTGTSIGSAEYAAPEQTRGKAVFASDLYSLGVTCLHLMTRTSPFTLYSDDQGEWVWRDFLPRGQHISPKLGEIVDQLIAPPLGKRFASAQEVLFAIHPPAPPPSPPPQPRQPKHPKPPVKEPRSKSPLPIDQTPGGSLGRSSGSTLDRDSKGGRRGFLIGLGVLTAAAVVGRQWLSNTPTPQPTPTKFTPDSKTFNLPNDGGTLELIAVPGGTLQMEWGSGWWGGHNAIKLQPFLMGRYPITQRQYQAIMGKNPSYFKGDLERPVEQVSWDDAIAFCQKLSQMLNQTIDLPSETQWEWAARGATQSKGYEYAGSNNLDEVGWYSDNSGNTTHPVGQKKPNELGIYDMSGNVWEWCKDSWADNTNELPQNGAAFTQGGDSNLRALRVGSWSYYARYTRSAVRLRFNRDYRNYCVGFRVVLVR